MFNVLILGTILLFVVLLLGAAVLAVGTLFDYSRRPRPEPFLASFRQNPAEDPLAALACAFAPHLRSLPPQERIVRLFATPCLRSVSGPDGTGLDAKSGRRYGP